MQLFHGRSFANMSNNIKKLKIFATIFAILYLGSEREATQLIGDERMLDEENLQDISRAALQQGQLEPSNLIARGN